MQDPSENLYCVDSIVQLEQIEINWLDPDKSLIDKLYRPAHELMARAGEAVFEVIKTCCSDRKKNTRTVWNGV